MSVLRRLTFRARHHIPSCACTGSGAVRACCVHGGNSHTPRPLLKLLHARPWGPLGLRPTFPRHHPFFLAFSVCRRSYLPSAPFATATHLRLSFTSIILARDLFYHILRKCFVCLSATVSLTNLGDAEHQHANRLASSSTTTILLISGFLSIPSPSQ